MGVMNQVPEVEVEQVEAVARFTDEDKGPPTKDTGKNVLPGKAEDDAAKEGHEQAVVNDGVWNARTKPEQEEDGGESEKAQEESLAGFAGNEFIEAGDDDAEGEARQVRNGRVFECLQPWPFTIAVNMREVIGIEEDVKNAGDEAEKPDKKQTAHDGQSAVGTLPFGEPRKGEIEEPLGGHGPGGRVEEGSDFRNPALQKQRRKDHCEPEHGVCVLTILRGQIAPGKDEAEQVNGIDPRETGLPEADVVELAFTGARCVVVGQDVTGEQDKEADGGVTGVDDRCENSKPIGIREMKENDVDGREGAQAGQRIQPVWLTHLH